jgi:uncharacterized protein YodC (DUF2158 family)
MNKYNLNIGDILIATDSKYRIIKDTEYVDENHSNYLFKKKKVSEVMFIKEYKTNGKVLWEKNGMYKLLFYDNEQPKKEVFIKDELEEIEEVHFKAFE